MWRFHQQFSELDQAGWIGVNVVFVWMMNGGSVFCPLSWVKSCVVVGLFLWMTFVSVGGHICKCDLCEVTEAATTLWGKQQHVKEQEDILEKWLRTSTPSARRASSRGTVKTWPAVFLLWSMQRRKNERWLQEEQQAVPIFKSLDRRSSQRSSDTSSTCWTSSLNLKFYLQTNVTC